MDMSEKDVRVISLDCLAKLKSLVSSPKLTSVEMLQKKITEFSKDAAVINEPYIDNVMKYCFAPASIRDLFELKALYLFRIQNAMKSISSADSAIKLLASKKIPKGGAVLIHGNNQLAFEIIESALKAKKFEVLTLSSNDFLISEMKKAKIRFQCFPDSAVRAALENADLVLLSSKAITPAKIINSVGGSVVAEIACSLSIPVYACAPAMSFSQQYSSESTKIKHGNAIYRMFDYEPVEPGFLTGIISELGIYGHAFFISALEKEMPWLFIS